MIRFNLIVIFFSFVSAAFADHSVQFTNKELSAVITLMRPELNFIELHGRKAILNPSPSVKYLGVEASETPLDMSVIANIVDLEFNHVKTKTPEIKLLNGSFELSIAVENRVRAVQSNLGSISFQDVVLKTQLGWNTRTDGTQELVLLKTTFEGSLKGTGILRSNYILGKTRDLCVSLLGKSLRKFLMEEKLQNSIRLGLIEYGKFYTGAEVKEVTSGSIQFVENGMKFNMN